MSKPYIHYAWHLSYFSGKSRSYLQYKAIPYVEKSIDMYTFSVRAKKRTNAAVMPIVVTPEGEWLQDTSVIIDTLEERFPEAPVVPSTPVQKFASYVTELWADEWWLVIAMYTRWCHPENYVVFEHDAGTQLLPHFPWFMQKRAAAKAAGMMRHHLPALGIASGQIELLAEWTRDMLDVLDRHFVAQPFLFGDRPSLGDFGLIGPLYAHLGRDPWSKRELIDPRRNLRAWVDRMNNLKPRSGSFLPNDQIPATLEPMFRAIFRELIPQLQGIAREVNTVLPKYRDRPCLPRGLGEIEFPMGKGSYRRAALPYTLWMVQRLQGVYRSMTTVEQAQVNTWLQSLGGEGLLELEVPPLKRVGLRVAAA